MAHFKVLETRGDLRRIEGEHGVSWINASGDTVSGPPVEAPVTTDAVAAGTNTEDTPTAPPLFEGIARKLHPGPKTKSEKVLGEPMAEPPINDGKDSERAEPSVKATATAAPAKKDK